MKKLFFILFSTISFAQSPEIYGFWVSQEGEYVKINRNNTFNRFKIKPKTKEKIILSKGIVKMSGKELHIIRKDTVDGYNLCYYVGNETMVICKPRSEKAWLWQKISD
jgi:hypothetical protein|tara:strand:- start:207 stop:530 length:324 start_codon:yes stop_codon:yes gene_type:complete